MKTTARQMMITIKTTTTMIITVGETLPTLSFETEGVVGGSVVVVVLRVDIFLYFLYLVHEAWTSLRKTG